MAREQSPIQFQPAPNGGVIVNVPGALYYIDPTTWDFIVAACPPRRESGGDRIIRTGIERIKQRNAERDDEAPYVLGRDAGDDPRPDRSGDADEVREHTDDIHDCAACCQDCYAAEAAIGQVSSFRGRSHRSGSEDPGLSGEMGAGSGESRDVDLDGGLMVSPVSEQVGEGAWSSADEKRDAGSVKAWNDPASDDR